MPADYNYELHLPFGPPPVLPDFRSQVEDYLLNSERLPLFDLDVVQKYWARKACPESLFQTEMCPVPTTLQVERDPATGKLLGFKEVPVHHSGCTAKNSTSMKRLPGPPEEAIRGSPTNYPFWPGGMPEPTVDDFKVDDDTEIDFENNLLTVPPGFSHGVSFESPVASMPLVEETSQETMTQTEESSTSETTEQSQPISDNQTVLESKREPKTQSTILNLASVLHLEGDSLGLWKDTKKEEAKKVLGKEMLTLEADIDMDVDEIIPEDTGVSVLKISVPKKEIRLTSTEWAEEVNVVQPVTDFDQKIPKMAHQYPFKLDTFQQQAILHMEQNESVFVAAHTSAGKTVVAEYAIALSQNHKTRTIYTSPIKALSNQKFRDFKQTFEDVGLLTGDIQINAKATCLIMTTEILRSMLYKGSDIIRDLEWVIFDEVHYINDSERGVVWEEALILLPQQVNIVMLSATVPNAMEFADWVGRTKKKKIYVIKTLKRPVPLEHFLYTGSGGKSKDERFLLVDSSGTFLKSGHEAAVQAKKERQSKTQQSFGTRTSHQQLLPKQEKTMWIGLLDHLKRKDKLPIVAFTLSRNRCDQNAKLLSAVDNTDNTEKMAIERLFQKSIQRLSDTDKKLQQVNQMQELLSRGIGVHHSGILPILKEIIEILFQKGLIKLLFATETFAVGVNMPARTVIFDSIQKHDGVAFRNLLPAEYIQMAGRAGRRNLDKTGTVIILCKTDVPDANELGSMMLGKPTKLESKFRLTYTMILNILRVEELRMEEIMKRSFSEVNQQRKFGSYHEKLQALKKKVQEMPAIETDSHKEIEKFYEASTEYLLHKEKLQGHLLASPHAVKILSVGRVIVVTHQLHVNKLGVLLGVDRRDKEPVYEVFVLTDDTEADEHSATETEEISLKPKNTLKQETEKKDDRYFKYLGLADESIFIPNGIHGHTILYVKANSVNDICDKTVKTDAEKVRNDWKKRQIPRFRDSPPGQACSSTTMELLKLSQSGGSGLRMLDPVADFKIQDVSSFEKIQVLQKQKSTLSTFKCTDFPDFKEQFYSVYQRMNLMEKVRQTEFLLSEDSLFFLPEYRRRLEVLCSLNYIDENNAVEMKGRVACGMANHELMITELVFHNILLNLEPTEIAALLSCLVFQQRKCQDPNWDALKASKISEGVKEMKEVAKSIMAVQKKHELKENDGIDELNFGLVEVVYEWARGVPFTDIMQLTDVQEGIIVRCIQRLDETIRDVKKAAQVVGNPLLASKMDEASAAIKRDIVFMASLYIR